MSYSFDGVDDVMTVGSTALGLTVTMWARIKPAASYGEAGRGIILAWGVGAAGADQSPYSFALTSATYGTNTLTFGLGRATLGRWALPNNTVVANQWQSVAVTMDANVVSNDPLLYYNGVAGTVLQDTQGSGSLATAATTTYVGNSSLGNRTFEGLIGEVAVWTRILDPAEVARVHLRGPLPVLRGLYLWWRGSPTGTALDRAGYGRHGTVSGALFNADNPPLALVP